jgi:hypothetical protein
MFSIQKAEDAWRDSREVGAAETSEGDDVSRAHSAVVRAPMARREGILVFVEVECNDVGIAFKLLMGIVSQRPALIKASFCEGNCWRCKVKMSVLVGRKVQRGRKTSFCCGEGGLLSKQEVAVVTALARA